ncbi:MAG: chromosome segregation protein SMC [Planctomycetaceae bacterium]|nr:chromosome segregation protein SMC [Planctomycetaceae bacterium]
MLKSLEMYGFKSFADRTRFDFAAGITGVVGPNGSGKSNVVDALKWILGDQSAKSLRGKEMTDVIFNGSSSRKPCSYAEAFLTIDNTQKILAVAEAEVVIGRRLYRSGDAEYLINRQTARLKDVRDLLLGTGAGNAAYSIIEQGRVDQILQANPSARRSVFEEAAGVSRFKSRRVEAQRKLERVAQNLQRLSDIVDEVEARLNTTRGQAAKAVKYREISGELKVWWLGLAADDYRHATAEMTQIAERLAEIHTRLRELTEAQKACDSQEAQFDRQLAQIEQQSRVAERRLSQHREELASQEASVRFQSTRLQELETELAKQREQQWLLMRREQDAVRQIATDRGRLAELEAETHRLRTRVDSDDAQVQAAAALVAQARETLESRRQSRQQTENQLAALEQAIAAYQVQQTAIQESQQKLERRWTELQQELGLAEALREELLREYEKRQQHVAELQDLHRTRQSAQQELTGRQETLRSRIADLREARSAALARRSLLEDLEIRQEGLGLGVKELLHRARHSHEPPWNSIVGSVSDLLDVDLEYAGLIEVALGSRSQLIVLREFQPLLDYLAKGVVVLTGRVGFVAVPERTQTQPVPPHRSRNALIHLLPSAVTSLDLADRDGVVMRADRLVSSEHGVLGLAAALLADTWVVQDLDAAVSLSLEYGPGVRFVTLQGELLDSHGVLQLGTVRSETSLLSRKSELRRIRNDLLRLERDVVTCEAEAAALQRQAEATDEQLALQKQQLDAFGEELSDAMAAWRSADQNADRARREIESLAGQRRAAEDEVARLQRLHDDARERWEIVREELMIATREQTSAESELTTAMQAAQALEQRKAAERLDLFKFGERLESIRATIVRLEEDAGQRRLQSEEAQRRVAASESKRQQIILHLLKTRSQLAEGYGDADRLQAEVTNWQIQKGDLRQQRSAYVAEEQRIRKERRELQDRQHADEIRNRELQQALATMAERIQDEYQLSLVDVAASEASAWERWRQSRPGTQGAKNHEDEAEPAPPAEPAGLAIYDEREFPEVRPEIEAHVTRLRRKLKLLGSVNTDSLNDLEQLEQRFLHLSTQLQDLVEAKATLEDIIRRMNLESRRLFAETFQTIRKNFQHLFRKVFGGGEGDIVLEDPEDILECGIEITARPPGKELRSLSLLSGGEKTMTAIAMIMAIFQAKPSPFCILDEVDAALDEANVDRFANVLREFQTTTQFIMITHHKRSMLVADVLYGVTMEESGISKRMSVRFDDITEDGNFRRNAAA